MSRRSSAEATLAVSRSDVMRGAVAVLVGLNVINGLNIALIDRGHWLLWRSSGIPRRGSRPPYPP